MEDFIGVKCDEVGLTASNIKERISQVTVTNGILLELRSLKDPAEWRSIAEELGCLPNSLGIAIKRVKTRYQRLRKNADERGRKASEAFLTDVFKVPKIKPAKPSQNKKPVNTPCSNCLTLVEGIEAEAKRRERRVRVQEQKIADSAEEMNKLKKIGITRLQDIYSIIGKVGTPEDVVREIKKLNRNKLLWESRFRALKSSYKNLKTLHNRALCRSKSLQAQLNREKAKKTKPYRRQKHPTQQPLTHTDDLHHDRDELQEQINKLCSVQTNEGRQLSDNMRQVSYFIQDQGVAENRVSDVIRTVMETLGNRLVEHLPSTSTQGLSSSEMKAISRQQVMDGQEGKIDIPMTNDSTTKSRLGHLADVETSTKSKTFSIRVVQHPDRTTKNCSHVQEELLDNGTTMTVRCTTKADMNEKLEEQSGKSFGCAMHPLDTFALQANTILKNKDTKRPFPMGSMPQQNPEESSIQAVLRAADNLFHNSSSEDTIALKKHLMNKGLQSDLQKWVGNRFNVLFENASILFCCGDRILEYFTKVLNYQNDFQKEFVDAWINAPKTHLRCLGLLYKTFMRPWKRMVGLDMSVLAMNDVFHQTRTGLQVWRDRPLRILDGLTIFGHDVQNDICWTLLTQIHGVPEDEIQELKSLLTHLIDGMIRVIDSQLSTQ